jgi:predicted nucleotidyltransferase
MRFKDFIKESIIDIPRRTYAPGVFDNADTDNPRLKQSVINIIKNDIEKHIEPYGEVERVYIIGSILTKTYRNDADVDIDIVIKPNAIGEEEIEKVRKDLVGKFMGQVNGKNIPGTEHPINYYIQVDRQISDDHLKNADGHFDVLNNMFTKVPNIPKFNIDLYIDDFNKKVQEIDVVKGELKRDIIDYDELKSLSVNDVLNLQEKIKDKLEEIEDSIIQIKDIGDDLSYQRKEVFLKDMTPDQIKTFGVANNMPANVIFKLLEKYHYITFYKKCKQILDDGVVTDKEIESLKQEDYLPEAKSIAFTFGRFNPPTTGHEKLIQKVKSIPTDDYKIFLSRSEDPKKNPLSPRQKLDYMKKMFPQHARNIEINTTNMVLDIATKLYKQGYDSITMVVGSDRVREFDTILKKYNDVKSRHGYYNFKKINVASAGDRDPDAEGVSGMSASKMRAAAEKGDVKSFKTGLPSSFRDTEKLFKDVRKGMNLAANYTYVSDYKPIASLKEFEQQQIRDLYVREMIFNIGDKVNYVKEDIDGKVVRRGTNYVVVEDNENNLHKAWIWDCLPDPADREAQVREHNLDVDYGFKAVSKEDLDRLPQDKDVKKKDGTQPKKYYKDMSKDTKNKRADHFKSRDTTKNDNRPAPGDKDAKTKPSVHTQKYKKMFGELKKELSDACWTGYKQVGMKKKGNKQVPNCVPEAYDIGHDYAQHTLKVTPGQDGYDPNYQGGSYKPSVDGTSGEQVVTRPMTTDISVKDINDWAASSETIDKYKERYKEEWKAKLSEVVSKMIRNI